jgi:hypothetical protein
MQDYCTEWGMKINVEKTKIVVFRRARRRGKERWRCDGPRSGSGGTEQVSRVHDGS